MEEILDHRGIWKGIFYGKREARLLSEDFSEEVKVPFPNLFMEREETYESYEELNSSLLVPSVIYKTDLGAQSKPRIILTRC